MVDPGALVDAEAVVLMSGAYGLLAPSVVVEAAGAPVVVFITGA